jgi:hypothetical protein
VNIVNFAVLQNVLKNLPAPELAEAWHREIARQGRMKGRTDFYLPLPADLGRWGLLEDPIRLCHSDDGTWELWRWGSLDSKNKPQGHAEIRQLVDGEVVDSREFKLKFSQTGAKDPCPRFFVRGTHVEKIREWPDLMKHLKKSRLFDTIGKRSDPTLVFARLVKAIEGCAVNNPVKDHAQGEAFEVAHLSEPRCSFADVSHLLQVLGVDEHFALDNLLLQEAA